MLPAGRGAPEIDILEYGILAPPGQSTPVPTFVHTMQMGPIAPLFTSFMLPDASGQIPGIHLPGADDPARGTYLSPPYGAMDRPGFPRAGERTDHLVLCASVRGRMMQHLLVEQTDGSVTGLRCLCESAARGSVR